MKIETFKSNLRDIEHAYLSLKTRHDYILEFFTYHEDLIDKKYLKSKDRFHNAMMYEENYHHLPRKFFQDCSGLFSLISEDFFTCIFKLSCKDVLPFFNSKKEFSQAKTRWDESSRDARRVGEIYGQQFRNLLTKDVKVEALNSKYPTSLKQMEETKRVLNDLEVLLKDVALHYFKYGMHFEFSETESRSKYNSKLKMWSMLHHMQFNSAIQDSSLQLTDNMFIINKRFSPFSHKYKENTGTLDNSFHYGGYFITIYFDGTDFHLMRGLNNELVKVNLFTDEKEEMKIEIPLGTNYFDCVDDELDIERNVIKEYSEFYDLPIMPRINKRVQATFHPVNNSK